MMGWPFGRTLPVDRTCRCVCVGGRTVDVLFDVPLGGAESLSAEAVRLAEDLVGGALGLARGRARVATLVPSGRPVALVNGEAADLSLSISHVHGLVGAAVSSDASVGLDIVDPADAGRFLDCWFTPDELALVPDDHGLLRAMLWAAKEAAYKAARLDTEFRPRMVTIASLSPHAFDWIVRDRDAEVRGNGCFAMAGRHVIAIAATRHSQAPRDLVSSGACMREPVACS